MPPHPALRAKARIIMDHFDRHFTPLFYRILIRHGSPPGTKQSQPLCSLPQVVHDGLCAALEAVVVFEA